MKDAIELFASRFAPPALTRGGALAISSLTGSADAFLALALAEHSPSDPPKPQSPAPRLVLAVVPGIPDADRLTDDLRILTERRPTRILEFPPLIPDDRSALGLRLKTIAALRSWSLNPYPAVLVAPFPALATPIKSGSAPLTLSTASAPAFSALCNQLARLGYERLPQVEKEGDCSVRGGIVDIWSPGDDFPVRAEFFGDDLESLRTFNPATQTSIERIDRCEILPVSEGEGEEEVEVEDGVEVEGGVKVEGGKRRKQESIFDLLPEDAVVLALEHNAYDLSPFLVPNDRTPPRSPNPKSSNLKSSNQTIVFTGDPAPRGVAGYAFQTTPLPGFAELGADEAHHPELFEAARQRLAQHLAAAEKRSDVVLKLDDLSGGFEIAGQSKSQDEDEQRNVKASDVHLESSPSPNLLVVTKADRVFTKRRTRALRAAVRTAGARIDDFDDLEPGEYVVHLDYGVGRYIGSTEIVTGGKHCEVFTIEYADGAKLHVPATHAHLLSRYVGVKGESVKLHRLGGTRWTKDKVAAQKAVTDLAAALLETQAKRELVPGFAYDTACDGLDAFEAAFPYEETPDQLAAIAAIKKDLASRKPMDRLICGDAGYGKTEVAMRAAYIAALNGKQTAVLAPTTVLAEQHFETFTSRFDGTPVRIESVSRFQSDGTHKGTFQRLATGACDIVIGTHAILSSRIAFHDLGLIIIDEEQRFGVKHKEFLKTIRATADILTLSATPIPRTLYLSMTGARDLSLLRSPPRERVAVETLVVRDSDEVVRAAIRAELDRGGQVFFLHNRVTTISKVEKRLSALFVQVKVKGEGEERKSKNSTVHLTSSPSPIRLTPRIVVAHGQMDAATLARKMRAFERGEYDILLSTTIIESGIDIPRANTIIVDQADRFGLADLYQLRGRVGRSTRQGHALFLLPPSGIVDADARERLAALKRHGGLGAGFNLAVRDLELRGAGNLLGSQQSGHIAAIGFGLYCQLLQRTIAALKGEKLPEIIDVKLNLDFIDPSPACEDGDAAAAVPYDYIEEDVQRMSFLKRLAEATDLKVVKALGAEMADRYGKPPVAVKRLLRIAELRVVCAEHRIDHIDVGGTRAIFYRVGSRDIAFVRDLKGKTPDRKLAELLRYVTDSDACR